MTREEYEDLKPGDLVRLVDEIREIANNEGDNYVLDSIFVPGNHYVIRSTDCTNDNWIEILKNEQGGSGHGWPYSRWETVDSKSSENLYKILGMEAN